MEITDEKILEINVTSPCFFIKEINEPEKVSKEKDIIYKDSQNILNQKR